MVSVIYFEINIFKYFQKFQEPSQKTSSSIEQREHQKNCFCLEHICKQIKMFLNISSYSHVFYRIAVTEVLQNSQEKPVVKM